MLSFNPTGEAQIAASDGTKVIVYPRLSTDELRTQFDDARRRRLAILSIALYNCDNAYVYDWRLTLQRSSWMNCKLVMARKRGEFKNTQHAVIMPAREQVYSLEQFEQKMLSEWA